MFGFGGLDVLTIGGGTRDVFIKSKYFEKKSDPNAPGGFDACFPMGAKITLDDLYIETGGGATNAAATFKQLGYKTACLCRVGADANGLAVKDALASRGIITKFIQTDLKTQTSYAVILLSDNGERSILVYRGASDNLKVKEADWQKIKTSWIYLTSLGGRLNHIRDIFAAASKMNSKIAWNPGNGEIKLGLGKLKKYIKQTELLFLNREESAMLTNEPPRHLETIIKKLGSLPKAALVITDGPNGAYAYDSNSNHLFYAKAIPGKRINSTGAGDAFGSGFTSSYIKDGDIKNGLCVGSHNSIGVITTMGAKVGILNNFPSAQKMKLCKIKKIKVV